MTREKTYNFAAGPSVLPEEALKEAAAEMLNYRDSGMSVMEMSHRSSVYQEIFNETKNDLRNILAVPETHEILFLQGGASTQFSMIPLNLISATGEADYAITGNFAKIAAKEAGKYGKINIAADTFPINNTRIPTQEELVLSENASYFYYCANNTIFGTEWKYTPDTGKVPLVADMSSNILTKAIDWDRHGIVYAGAQKNMAPAGVTVVIIRKDLAGHELPFTPLMMNYQTMIDKDSMYNTPPCYSIYMLGKVLKWVEKNGGIAGMEKMKKERANKLYDFIAESALYKGCAERESASDMNVTFTTGDKDLDAAFAKEAGKVGIQNIKGHRLVGAMRASIYNAQPMESVDFLIDFMKKFEADNK